MATHFPAILSDIGGTNARFAIVRDALAPIEPLPASHTRDFPTFDDALATALHGIDLKPRSCLVCAAGPVEGSKVRLTNANWDIDLRASARQFGFDAGRLFNDFEGLAYSIPSLDPSWLRSIGQAGESSRGARVIHGPGTGLGTSALIEVEGKWRALPSEGSHSDFAAVYPDEHRIWPHIEPRLGRITPESLISGPGMRRLHRARLAAEGLARAEIDEATIINRAIADPRGREADTVRMFWRLEARYAGDIALNFLAKGGVILAGGMLPRIIGLLNENEFRTTFENKAPYNELARRIPVHIVMKSDAIMHGLAAIARHPERYALELDTFR